MSIHYYNNIYIFIIITLSTITIITSAIIIIMNSSVHYRGITMNLRHHR